jgi:DNA-binding MarR family transcriptional regulator
VRLTDEGREQMASKQRAMVARLEEMLEPLTPDDRSELLRLVRLVTAAQAHPERPWGPPSA